MQHELFLNRRMLQLQVNPLVKAFIVSEVFMWSSVNILSPILALFAVQILGGEIKTAATAYSLFMISRVVFSLITGKLVSKASLQKRLWIIVGGSMLISIANIGFIFTDSLFQLFLFNSLIGVGLGIVLPIKQTLFSTHLDKENESVEWGVADAVVLAGNALSAVAGGLIAATFGFTPLFIIAAGVNILGIFPYLLIQNSPRAISH